MRRRAAIEIARLDTIYCWCYDLAATREPVVALAEGPTIRHVPGIKSRGSRPQRHHVSRSWAFHPSYGIIRSSLD